MGLLDFLRGHGKRGGAPAPIPDELWDWAMAEHRIFRSLDADEKSRLRDLSARFLACKRFEAVDGAELDDRLRISVAAQACLPLISLDLSWYRDFTTIFITPDAYPVTQRWEDSSGVLHEYEDSFAGESFSLGPVALSIPDIDASGWGDGYNVVIHEMAHKIDGRNGVFDGCPPLPREMDRSAWKRAFTQAYDDLAAKLDNPGPGGRRTRGTSKRRPRIDAYAAESPDEFFAVVCEYFWERPSLLLKEYPEVYEQLKQFFRQDPAARE